MEVFNGFRTEKDINLLTLQRRMELLINMIKY